MKASRKNLDFLGFPDYWIDNSGVRWRLWKYKGWKSFRDSPDPSDGYVRVTLCYKGKTKRHYLHELVLLAFVGDRPKNKECRHLDGDKTNNALSNLVWGTRKENGEDKVRHGNSLRGSKHPMYGKTKTHNSKLNDELVRKLRKEYKYYSRGENAPNLRTLSKKHGVTITAMWNAIKGNSYKFVTP